MTESLLTLACALDGIRSASSKELGLTPQQGLLLASLAAGPLSHGQLADRLHCDKTNITGIVDRLQRQGLVQRETDEVDRRVVNVSLSEPGAALVSRYRQSIDVALSNRLTDWPADDRRRLIALATKAAASLADAGPAS